MNANKKLMSLIKKDHDDNHNRDLIEFELCYKKLFVHVLEYPSHGDGDGNQPS